MLGRTRIALTIQRRYLLAPHMLSKALIMVRRLLHKFAIDRGGKMADQLGVPMDAREMGFALCRDSIGGVWAEVPESQLQIRPLR